MKKLLAFVAVGWICFAAGRLSQQQPANAEGAGGQSIPPPPCQDVNGDGQADISDGIYLLSWLFLGGPAPECTDPADLEAEIQNLQTQLAECLAGNCPPSKLLPDTGQTTCYDVLGDVVDCASDTCAGQDSFYSTGCPPEGRFVDNGDGTVTDNCTGLMWQKDTGNDGNGLPWCPALAYCEALELAGHTDWRLPNVRELQSIVDYGRVLPAIDPVFSALSSFHWSSTSRENDPSLVWFVGFHGGQVDEVFKDVDYGLVRAVRTIQPGE